MRTERRTFPASEAHRPVRPDLSDLDCRTAELVRRVTALEAAVKRLVAGEVDAVVRELAARGEQ